jgi:hypothetical protein
MRDCARAQSRSGNRSRREKETGERQFLDRATRGAQSSENRLSSSAPAGSRPSPWRTSAATVCSARASASSSWPNAVRFSSPSPRARSATSCRSAARSRAIEGATAAGQRAWLNAASIFARDRGELGDAPFDLRLRRHGRCRREELHEVGPRSIARRHDHEVTHTGRRRERPPRTVRPRAAFRGCELHRLRRPRRRISRDAGAHDDYGGSNQRGCAQGDAPPAWSLRPEAAPALPAHRQCWNPTAPIP